MENLTVCIYSVSNGHWDKKDCYLRTIQDLETHNIKFGNKIAHIKIRPGEEEFAAEMESNFIKYGYKVLKTVANWKRWHGSHSIEQLNDIFKVSAHVNTNYILHLEDDWVLRPLKNDLQFWLLKSIELLENNLDILQVRIPRQINEFEHFKTMEKVDENWKKQNEIFSLNPHIIRKKDLEIILNTVAVNQDWIIPNLKEQRLNVELLFAEIGRQYKGEKPFWSHSSENIRAFHIGNKDFDDTLEKVY